MDTKRAGLASLLDDDDETPIVTPNRKSGSKAKEKEPVKPKITKAAMKKVAREGGVPSREAQQPAEKRRRGRPRSNRTVQWNVKISPEAYNEIVDISDEKGWVFGEFVDQALIALKGKQERE